MLLLCLGIWVLRWTTTPVMAALRLHFTSLNSSRVHWPNQPPLRRRNFVFQQGGQVQLAPRSLDSASRYDYYAALASQFHLQPSRTTVIGLRGLTPNGRRHPSGDNMSDYDDTFVVLKPQEGTAREFLGATHAGQAASSLSPSGGVAQIHPGLYTAIPIGNFNSMAAWWITSPWGDGELPCFRDKNANGFIDPDERHRTLYATEILFHNGRQQDYGTSIGCQVLPPDAMQNFIRTVGAQECFDYLLIDANRPL